MQWPKGRPHSPCVQFPGCSKLTVFCQLVDADHFLTSISGVKGLVVEFFATVAASLDVQDTKPAHLKSMDAVNKSVHTAPNVNRSVVHMEDMGISNYEWSPGSMLGCFITLLLLVVACYGLNSTRVLSWLQSAATSRNWWSAGSRRWESNNLL